jgi:hypothetical protein
MDNLTRKEIWVKSNQRFSFLKTKVGEILVVLIEDSLRHSRLEILTFIDSTGNLESRISQRWLTLKILQTGIVYQS